MDQLNQFIQSHPKLQHLLYIIGICFLTRKSIQIISFLIKNLLRPCRNLQKRYGQDSWVFITGSSDGIGKQIAIEFAKRQFNIVLVARNKQKLEKVEKEIKEIKNVQTKIVVADFLDSTQDNFYDRIMDQVQDIDISILINNVGMDCLDYYHNHQEDRIKNIITINTYPISLLTYKFIPKLLKRNKKSAIVNVTSLAGEVPSSGYNVYSASKAFQNYLTESLTYEYPQLDIIQLSPSEVSTQMTYNRPPDFMTLSANDCARGLFSKMGYDTHTNGDWRHQLQGILYRNVSVWLFNTMLLKVFMPQWIKERKSGLKKD